MALPAVISPGSVTTFPGARVLFTAEIDDTPVPLSDGDWEVIVYFPGEEPENGTILEDTNQFFWVAPPNSGEFEVSVLVIYTPAAEEHYGTINVTINPAQASIIIATNNMGGLTPPVHMDFYDPTGEMVHTQDVTASGPNYTATKRPGLSWISGEYQIILRDANGVQDVDSQWVERPKLASMPTFYALQPWHRQLITYIKYTLMGDEEPMKPGALLTLEQYAEHWTWVVQEINDIPPYSDVLPGGVPYFWSNVITKGLLCRVYHALANRSVTIPRWTGIPVAIQDESHYQQAWEARYNLLRPEYTEERAYMKAAYLPDPSVTVDPWLGWGSGNLAGTSSLAFLGRPTWFTRNFGGRA